jgi:ubiquinone/menaquinone biosynthesis C-methylase UbiE
VFAAGSVDVANHRNDETRAEQNKEAEREFFDRFVESRAYDVFTERGYQRIIREFRRHADIGPGTRVLDLGCGTGEFVAKFTGSGATLAGLDLSVRSIDLARQRHPGIEFSVGDAEATPYPDASFDVVFLSGLLHHLPSMAPVVAECWRLLRDGGVVLAYDPHRGHPIMWLYRCPESPFYSSRGVTPNERPLAKRAIAEAFATKPFREFSVFAVSGVTYKYVEGTWASRLLRVYNLIELMLDLPVVRAYAGAFVITYARK